MSLAGGATVVIWNDVVEGARGDFVAWHNREHIPERLSVPGFRRGRRCRAVTGGPEFLTLYEADGIDVLSSGPYLDRLNAPSDATRRVLPQFRNTARSLCRVAASLGCGIGGFIATVRFAGATDDLNAADATAEFSDVASGMLHHSAEMTGAHLLMRDLAASGQKIEETRLRTESVTMPGAVILLEATSARPAEEGASALSDALGGFLAPEGPIGLHQLEFCLTAEDCARHALAARLD